jgi:hypothetical protein
LAEGKRSALCVERSGVKTQVNFITIFYQYVCISAKGFMFESERDPCIRLYINIAISDDQD